MSKLYAERDIIEQGDFYSRHTSAMTGEGLHSKSDIAAELAHRDIQIERLRARVANYENIFAAVLSELEIMDESQGVAGWHLNGNVATWSEVGWDYMREALQSAADKFDSEAWLLRKQAEAIVKAAEANGLAGGRSHYALCSDLICDAKEMFEQADELEKAGNVKIEKLAPPNNTALQ